jgi:hypothetical protein
MQPFEANGATIAPPAPLRANSNTISDATAVHDFSAAA